MAVPEPLAGTGTTPTPADAATLRSRAYTLCLGAALVVLLAGHLWGGSLLAGLMTLAALGLLAVSMLASPFSRRLDLVSWGAGLAGLAALLVPFSAMAASDFTLSDALLGTAVWPAVLVLLFAGRLLAEACDAHFALFWNAPLSGGGHNRTQSLLAAFFTGAALTLLFTQFASGIAVDPARVDPSAIVLRALSGRTAIHAAIILLFFTVLAALLDAFLLTLNESAALGALKRLCRESTRPLKRAEIVRLARENLAGHAHSRVVQWVEEIGEPAGRALDGFHLASRRLIRALLSFLPLLGFLGTVIGLTAAIGGLPAGLGPQAKANLDISASLLGLAVKFETTLLGLLGGLIGTFLLALLEKRESEIAAECRRITETASRE